MLVALDILHAMHVCLPRLEYFSTLSQPARFSKSVSEHKMCGLIFSAPFVPNISNSKQNWMRYDQNGLHVKYLLFL
jgi:hypothetical protein